MVAVGIEGFPSGFAPTAFPYQLNVVVVADHHSHLLQLGLHSLDAVGLLDFQRAETRETERDSKGCAGHNEGLRQVGTIGEVVVEPLDGAEALGQHYPQRLAYIPHHRCPQTEE